MAETELADLCKRSLRINRYCNEWLRGGSPVAGLIRVTGCVSWRLASRVTGWLRFGRTLNHSRLGRVLRAGRHPAIAQSAPLRDFLVKGRALPRRFTRLSTASQVDWLCQQLCIIDDDITRICSTTTSMPLSHLLIDHHLDVIDALADLLRWQDFYADRPRYRSPAMGLL